MPEKNLGVIEPILNLNKVKYTMMDKLISGTDVSFDKTHVNFMINLDCIFKKFYSSKSIETFASLRGRSLISLTSETLNLIAHYRHYFWSRKGTTTSFYLYSQNDYVNDRLVDGYKKTYIDTKRNISNSPIHGVISDILASNGTLIQTISQYVDDAYYVASDGLDSIVIPALITSNTTDLNIILTNDKIEYQLASDTTFILRATGANSKLLNGDNIMSRIFKTKFKPQNTLDIGLYPAYIATVGDTDSGLPKIQGFNTTMWGSRIDTFITKHQNYNSYMKAPTNISSMLGIDDVDGFSDNYKTIDVRRSLRLLSDVDRVKLQNQIVNKYDINALEYLNANYFEYNYIQLMSLQTGVRGR